MDTTTTTRDFPSDTVNSTSNKETEIGVEPPSNAPLLEKGAQDSDSSNNGDRSKIIIQGPDVIIKIVSANYGPCEGLRLLTGELTNDEMTSIPVTRDVAPFLRALLVARRLAEDKKEESNVGKSRSNDYNAIPRIVRVSPTTGTLGTAHSFMYLLGGAKSMNATFGDPCPGTSKRLHVHYVITEAEASSNHNDDAKSSLAAKTQVHHVSFFEHEHVVLRRRLDFYQDDSQFKQAVDRSVQKSKQPLLMAHDADADEATLQQARRMGRSQSIVDFAQENMQISQSTPSFPIQSGPSSSKSITTTTPRTTTSTNTAPISHHQACPKNKWRLRSAVSEIVLPIVLPFLKVRERVQCRLLCKSWKHVVREWGVATTIDSNDAMIANFTRPFLRGILSHSYSSLHSLFLSGFEKLEKEDLHPSIPQLGKLRYLDVSRCYNLDDSTLELLAHHVHQTLQVLYIKGLGKVTDVGMKAICDACAMLEVLDISNVPLSDEGGMAIQKLTRLRALFTRDNYQLTNKSIDVITEKCTRLAQLVLWGSTKISHLSFDTTRDNVFSSGKLVFLNLWGCFNLKDEAAHALGNMKNLQSLIVSECHRLTDQFVVRLFVQSFAGYIPSAFNHSCITLVTGINSK
jgi:hypothetical protein